MHDTRLLLAVNCGSSSIKFKLFRLPDLQVVIYGSASNVAVKGARASIKYTLHKDGSGDTQEKEEADEGLEYDAVFEKIIGHLEQSPAMQKPARDMIAVVTHRVVHGGELSEPMVLWHGHEEGLDLLDKLSAFAPLHNHRAVSTVRSCLTHLPSSTQVLCFDTLFHRTLPESVFTYPLAPPPSKPAIPLRKYGAHGLSYAFVLARVAEHLRKPATECNLVLAHLGSGASVCMIRNGESVDTSMGLSPLDGLPGGTRSGAVDPALIFHHTPDAGATVEQNGLPLSKAELLLNKEGGMQALCGTSDFGTIIAQMDSSPPHRLAYDVFLDRLLHYVGAYAFKLCGRLDGLVFSGGIGERASRLRADVISAFGWMGGKLDEERNGNVPDGEVVWRVSAGNSGVAVIVCETDEETQCAQMAKDHLDKNPVRIDSQHK